MLLPWPAQDTTTSDGNSGGGCRLFHIPMAARRVVRTTEEAELVVVGVLWCFCFVAVNCQPLNFEKGFADAFLFALSQRARHAGDVAATRHSILTSPSCSAHSCVMSTWMDGG